MGDLMGGLLVERLASRELGADPIAWLTTCQILISLCCCFSFLIFGGALASGKFNARWCFLWTYFITYDIRYYY
jgi:hypothetical protein